MSIIKKEFVRRILKDEAERFEKNQALQMRRVLTFHTGTLERERFFSVTSDDSMDGKLTLKHKAYQRFLDIKKKVRSKNSRRLKQRRLNIHNRFVFGHFFSIANRLMYGFTEEVAEGIKRDLQN
ncbi:hypothetical protein C943_03315 [Mariniradius saccharolyticus AK6]|uniref:Uncharacterized protein n=1 Tax=Mariniradius saccharolyticus AK6 TaxID=1239962 RepID=M7XJ87_9BACT|nr:hypothetical protein [Mariniradius saccharolyticus]EMS34628.1 hypothetical protein C943_03315 [Mariniradius saccharolyticus AK6]